MEQISPPQPHLAQVRRDAMQPGGKLRRVVQLFELEVRLEKRLLSEVLGIACVSRKVIRQAIDRMLVPGDQLSEGVPVARQGSSDQGFVGR